MNRRGTLRHCVLNLIEQSLSEGIRQVHALGLDTLLELSVAPQLRRLHGKR